MGGGWVCFAWLGIVALGCRAEPFKEPMLLGGVEISAETLNLGYRVYVEQCVECHGTDGGGAHARAQTSKVPRNLTLGHFKYKSTLNDALPTDEDLKRVLRRGVVPSGMPPFEGVLSTTEEAAVIHYVKTFSPRWRNGKPGTPIALTPDPWKKNGQEAGQKRGREVYHFHAVCWRCHPAYVSQARLQAEGSFEDSVEGREISLEERGSLDRPRAVESVYGELLSPDLAVDTMRAGALDSDLYRVLVAGIGGTQMKGLHQELPPSDVWALVHYIQQLRRRVQ